MWASASMYFPYTLAEAVQALREGWGIIAIALREGIWLIDKEGVKEQLQALLRETETG
ncbi:MAG: hypothetical protein NZ765_00650 [Anaerolineae bacterium]|nr:hypothetical protein [Anaerolineae bacterium]